MQFLSPSLSPELIEKLCDHVSKHNAIQTAYRAEGISDSTFSAWMKDAEDSPHSLAGILKARLDQAEALAELKATEELNSVCMENASAVLWRQERRYGANWGKTDKSPGKNNGAVAAAAPQVIIPSNGRETPKAE